MLTLNKPHAFPKKMYLFAGNHLGCVADFIYPRLVIIIADILVLSKKRTQCISTCAL